MKRKMGYYWREDRQFALAEITVILVIFLTAFKIGDCEYSTWVLTLNLQEPDTPLDHFLNVKPGNTSFDVGLPLTMWLIN